MQRRNNSIRRNGSITVGSSTTGNTTPIKVDHATSTADDRKNEPWKRYGLLVQGFCELAAAEKEEFQELVTKDRKVHSVDNLTDWHEYYLEMLEVSSTDDEPSFYRASAGAEIPPVVRDLLNAPSAFSGFDYANSDWELSRSVYAAGLFTASIKGPITASPSAYPTVVAMVHCIVNEINREDAAVTGTANANANANANAAATNPEPATAGPSRQNDGQPPPPLRPSPPLRPPPPTPPRPAANPAPSRSRLRVALNHHPQITHYRHTHNRLDVYEARCDLAVLSGREPHVHCGILGRGRVWEQNRDGALEMMQTFLALCQEDERRRTGRLRPFHGIITSGLSVCLCEMTEQREFRDTAFRDILPAPHPRDEGRDGHGGVPFATTRLYHNIKRMLSMTERYPDPPEDTHRGRRRTRPRSNAMSKGKERATTDGA
ncbi:uncharacterized protein BO66DRAFT_405022 [Aspergillus aculeatinus CBS 121060]|uniref:Uncharacterized protein n=1 Tax=Aspergillus aculeatinus CBS 121060 TaxID=1448322 RepID=A0ACD1GXK5_9EURO|nr:hypothetical protein BO66DRAFT_405022 [Aspergillus aculeatinus CBS 121060]RAH66069.1 hypothetical protein BO66DRAFT_405022 [Aspergillus aculeatinus CBS 121060]